MKRIVLSFLLILLGVLTGCVSTPTAPDHIPELGTSVNSEGDLTISLNSEIGYLYTILYEDPKDRQLKPLKGAESIRGTGEIIEIKKRVNPRKPVPPLVVRHSRIVE